MIGKFPGMPILLPYILQMEALETKLISDMRGGMNKEQFNRAKKKTDIRIFVDFFDDRHLPLAEILIDIPYIKQYRSNKLRPKKPKYHKRILLSRESEAILETRVRQAMIEVPLKKWGKRYTLFIQELNAIQRMLARQAAS
jgi:hypothetical protein